MLLDGVHLCQAWLQHHGAPEYAVFDEEKLQRPQLQALAGRLPASACIALDARLMRELASVESGQGVLFLVHPPEPELPGRIAENCAPSARMACTSQGLSGFRTAPTSISPVSTATMTAC